MTEPVAVCDWEPPQAHSLEWLPLAVRFKLDAAGLKVGLAQWQALAIGERRGLLACRAGDAFEELLLLLLPEARRMPRAGGSWRDYLMARSPASRQPAGAV